MKNNSNYKLFILMIVGVVFTLSSCNDDDDDDADPVINNKKEGFILSVSTTAGSSLVKYFETLPSGTADVSDGFDFVAFNPQDIFNSVIYLQDPNEVNTSENGGLAKLVVDENGDFQIIGEIPTQGRVNPITIRDAETGIYYDFGMEESIKV